MTYQPPILTIDLVLFCFDEELDLNVLLLQRANEPFKGSWALPGGFVGEGETTFEALSKKIKNKTNVDVAKLKFIEQLYTFDSVARDPRGHAVSVCWYGLGRREAVGELKGENPAWIKVKDMKNVSFDHDEVIALALGRLKDKIWYSNIIFSLLPESFTLETVVAMYQKLDAEAQKEDIIAYLLGNNVIKAGRDDSYSVKINQLTYYKK